jgi:hypothetical protein
MNWYMANEAASGCYFTTDYAGVWRKQAADLVSMIKVLAWSCAAHECTVCPIEQSDLMGGIGTVRDTAFDARSLRKYYAFINEQTFI